LTRPDGILYFFVFPLFLCGTLFKGYRQYKRLFHFFILYLCGFLLVFGSYFIFRYFYFGEIYPNTYYAKGGGLSLSLSEWLDKIVSLFRSVRLSKALLIGIISLLVYIIATKKTTSQILVLLCMLFTSILIFMLLPQDWMPEFRFATPFFIFLYLSIFTLMDTVYTNIHHKKPIGFLLFLITILIAYMSIESFYYRSMNFARSPTVSFSQVSETFGVRFNDYANKLGIIKGSILLPDIGGTLFYSNLTVYDLAGLADKTIARTLGRDQRSFYNYVFEILKPTFIHTHGTWTSQANFDADPRFRKDYLPISEKLDKWLQTKRGVNMFSGDYIRRDSIKNIDVLLKLQDELK
jgi:hypothetical protein